MPVNSVPSATALTFEEWLNNSDFASAQYAEDFGITAAQEAFAARQPEIDALRERERRLREAVGAVTLAGGMMANLCFNGKQDARVPDNYRQSMQGCQRRWDVAVNRLAELLAAKEGA